MSNYENLIKKILDDAEAKKNSILDKAREEADIIVKNKIKEAKQIREKILDRANRDAVQLKDKIVSKTELIIKKNELYSKKRILDYIFSKSLDELINLDKEILKKYIVRTISNLMLTEGYTLLIPLTYSISEFESIIDGNTIVSVDTSNELKGGFILDRNGTRINYSFEVLINFVREEIEFEVANLLFS